MVKFLMIVTFLLPAIPSISYSHDYNIAREEIAESPRQECWTEAAAPRSRNITGTLIGGLAGGLLGHQVGKGNGRVLATAIGATTGALVGDRMAASPDSRTITRCRTVHEPVSRPVHNRMYVERDQYASYPDQEYYAEEEEGHRHDRGQHRGWHKRHQPASYDNRNYHEADYSDN